MIDYLNYIHDLILFFSGNSWHFIPTLPFQIKLFNYFLLQNSQAHG